MEIVDTNLVVTVRLEDAEGAIRRVDHFVAEDRVTETYEDGPIAGDTGSVGRASLEDVVNFLIGRGHRIVEVRSNDLFEQVVVDLTADYGDKVVRLYQDDKSTIVVEHEAEAGVPAGDIVRKVYYPGVSISAALALMLTDRHTHTVRRISTFWD